MGGGMSVRRVVVVWFALALVMSANGALRELVLRPQVGPPAADVVSAILGAIFILAATWFFFGRAGTARAYPSSGDAGFQRADTVPLRLLYRRTLEPLRTITKRSSRAL